MCQRIIAGTRSVVPVIGYRCHIFAIQIFNRKLIDTAWWQRRNFEQMRPNAPPATQNAAQKSCGTKIRKIGGQNLKFVDVYV